jgi:hypothetical protein
VTCADREIGPVRDRLDAAVAAASAGGLASPADDATFLRRAWLDLAGRIPPAEVARDFLDSKDPERRAKAVEGLLRAEEFADHWGRVLAIWVTSERPVRRDGYDGRVLHEFLRDRLRAAAPYDRVARELLVGSGASDASGPANFFLRYDADPPLLAGAVGKGFLGMTIQCAQCHDHPFARWKEEDFWGLAAAFARVRKLESTGGDDLKAVIEARKGELTRPNPDAPAAEATADVTADVKPGAEGGEKPEPKPEPKPVVVRPRLPDGKPLADGDRRRALADWVVSRGNPRFARNVVNRAWEALFGRPLVANLDEPNPKADSLPALVLLAEDFAANGHDLRRLLRIIVLSRSYAQASARGAGPAWARPMSRAMTVDQLYASIALATGYDGAPDEEEPKADEPHAADPHAEAMPPDDGDEDVGEDEDGEDLAVGALGERASTLQRALVLLNGPHVQAASKSAARIDRARRPRAGAASRLEWAFLTALGRRPSSREQAALRPLLDRPGGLEDVYWVLINSAEFQGIF